MANPILQALSSNTLGTPIVHGTLTMFPLVDARLAERDPFYLTLDTALAGGLTDVNVVLTVTDTMTGLVRTYVNPQGTAFQPIQDTSAFATCP